MDLKSSWKRIHVFCKCNRNSTMFKCQIAGFNKTVHSAFHGLGYLQLV